MSTTRKVASEATLERVREIMHQAAAGKVKVTHAFRYVAGHYKTVSRGELMTLAESEGLSAASAGTQYWAVKSGKTEPPKRLPI